MPIWNQNEKSLFNKRWFDWKNNLTWIILKCMNQLNCISITTLNRRYDVSLCWCGCIRCERTAEQRAPVPVVVYFFLVDFEPLHSIYVNMNLNSLTCTLFYYVCNIYTDAFIALNHISTTKFRLLPNRWIANIRIDAHIYIYIHAKTLADSCVKHIPRVKMRHIC